MWCPVLIVGLLWTQAIQPWMVVGLSLVVGVTDALSMPSFQSIVGTLVPREQMPTAIALNSTQFNLSRILGPAIAGVLMASVGALGAFSVSALSYVPFLLVALWILPRHVGHQGAAAPLTLEAMKVSVREVLAQAVLRWALLRVSVNSILCAPLIAFCPVLVRDALHGDVAAFSTAAAAFGVGGMVGALGLLGLGPTHDRGPLCAWFGVLLSGVVVLTGWNPTLALVPALFVGAGIAMTVSNTSANTLVQSQAPLHIRGQAVSMFMLAMRGGIALGALLTGLLVSWLGIRSALLLNGTLALLAHALVAWRAARAR
jgi:MFS family permease